MRFCIYLQRNKNQNISKWEKRLIPDPITDFKKQFWRSSPLALPRVRNAFIVGDTTHRDMVNLLTPQPRPTNTSNQGLLTPQLTPVWKPSNACLSSCKASLFCIRFICLNRSVLHSLPLSSPNPRRRRFFQSAQEEESLCRSFHLMRRWKARKKDKPGTEKTASRRFWRERIWQGFLRHPPVFRKCRSRHPLLQNGGKRQRNKVF